MKKNVYFLKEVCMKDNNSTVCRNEGNNSEKIPVLYMKKEECCGCTACYAICPKDAIYMEEDEEGFEYPKIDEKKCVRCYQCIKVCPTKLANKLYCKKAKEGI